MIIGIDISQVVYENTGVSRYVYYLTRELIKVGTRHSFVLFGVSRGRYWKLKDFTDSMQKIRPDIKVKIYRIPLSLMEFVWNVLHLIPITWFIGNVDVFLSSDWIQPPLGKVIGVTTIHDLSVLLDLENHDQKVVAVHKRRLKHAVSECRKFLVDSESTGSDSHKLLKIDYDRIHKVYPGFSL